MAAGKTTITLANGAEMPAHGFGCAFGLWTDPEKPKLFNPEEAWPAFNAAFRAGFKHFDIALYYGTHRVLAHFLGQQFAAGELKRSDIFITTKVAHPPAGLGHDNLGRALDISDPSIDLKKEVRKQIETCLDELLVGYVDLMLMHWPGKWGTKDAAANRKARKEVWEVFEEYHKAGKLRAIGVSNFHKHHLEGLIEDCTIVPMVNQIELSPYMTQDELVSFCQGKGIVLMGYAPFGSGATGVLSEPVIAGMAEKYKKNPGQVILRWLVQRGICVLPKSSNEGRMKSNLDVFDFELSAEDLAAISALNKNKSSVSGGVPGDDIA